MTKSGVRVQGPGSALRICSALDGNLASYCCLEYRAPQVTRHSYNIRVDSILIEICMLKKLPSRWKSCRRKNYLSNHIGAQNLKTVPFVAMNSKGATLRKQASGLQRRINCNGGTPEKLAGHASKDSYSSAGPRQAEL